MIFKWTSSKNKVAAEAAPETSEQAETPARDESVEVAEGASAAASAAPASTAQSAGQMAKELFEKVVPFKARPSSHEAEGTAFLTIAHESALGQEHALETLRFGAAIAGNDYNFLVAAPRGIAAQTLVREALKGSVKADRLADWVYVASLSQADRLEAMELPRGRAAKLKTLMARAIGELQEALPEVFRSETYQLRRLAIDDMHAREADGALGDLIQRAAAKNVAVLRLPKGFSVAPMHEGKVVRPEVLAQLPETMRREVEARVRGFQTELETLLSRVPHLDRARRSELRDLHDDIVAKAAALALADVREAFSDVPGVIARLDAIEKDMKAHSAVIVEAEGRRADIWRRYDVCVMQETATNEAPVIELIDLRAESLSGRFDGETLRGGALHQANGGALLISADGLLHEPEARELLVRALISGEISLYGERANAAPIPFRGKVAVIGEMETCERLLHVDQRMKKLFKLVIELSGAMARTKENEAAFGDAVQGLVSRHKTKPIDAAATALLLEEASLQAEDASLISLAIEDTADLLREASAWADISGDGKIERAHVERALKAREARRRGPGSQMAQGAGKAPAAAQGSLAKVFGS